MTQTQKPTVTHILDTLDASDMRCVAAYFYGGWPDAFDRIYTLLKGVTVDEALEEVEYHP